MKTFFEVPDNTLNNQLSRILNKKLFLGGKNDLQADFRTLSHDLIEFYAQIFFNGDKDKARRDLDDSGTGLETSDTVVISLLLGVLITLIILIGYFCNPKDGGPTASSELSSGIYVFSFTGSLVWILFAVGANIQIFKRFNINYEWIV